MMVYEPASTLRWVPALLCNVFLCLVSWKIVFARSCADFASVMWRNTFWNKSHALRSFAYGTWTVCLRGKPFDVPRCQQLERHTTQNKILIVQGEPALRWCPLKKMDVNKQNHVSWFHGEGSGSWIIDVVVLLQLPSSKARFCWAIRCPQLDVSGLGRGLPGHSELVTFYPALGHHMFVPN